MKLAKIFMHNMLHKHSTKELYQCQNTILCNKILTFANRPDVSMKGNKAGGLQKKNMTLVTQLFLSLQSRPDADMEEFFCFENQREPPSLADHGSLRSGNKSGIIECIKTPTGL